MATLKNVIINDTGFIQLPKGTTAERPGTPVTGMVRYNTDTNRNEIYNGAKWVTTQGSNAATGGTVTTSGGYKIHTFTTGTQTFTMTYDGAVELLVIGGGGGGAGIGGGGGAGGFIYESQQQLSAGNYSIVRGDGGGGEPSHNSLASPGNPSRIEPATATGFVQIAVGGGRGLPYARSESPAYYGSGGSGGGGPGGHGPNSTGNVNGNYPQAPTGHGAAPINFWHGGPLLGTNTGNNYDQISMEGNGYGGGVVGQGHPGGFGAHGGGFTWAAGNTVIHGGGGGGGAGSSGKPIANSNTFGSGGAGLASQISGTVVRYAGGGGGGMHGPGNPGHYGLSGAPGGGLGAFGGGQAGTPGANGGTGTVNTGGGGGGALHSSGPNVSGPGGPGIIIIRYRDV